MTRVESETVERHITERVRMASEADSCRALWTAVLQRAVSDLCYLEALGPDATKHERHRAGLMREVDPSLFLSSEWFRLICQWLMVDPDEVRGRVPGRAA